MLESWYNFFWAEPRKKEAPYHNLSRNRHWACFFLMTHVSLTFQFNIRLIDENWSDTEVSQSFKQQNLHRRRLVSL